MSNVKEIALILCIAVAAALGYNAFSERSISLIRVAPTKTPTPDTLLFGSVKAPGDTAKATPAKQPLPDSSRQAVYAPLQKRALANPDSMARLHAKKKVGYSVVSLEQVKKLREEKRGVFVDARPKEEFDEGHIPGAQNIPFLEIDDQFPALMKIPLDTLVVVYCTGSDCPLGRDLCDFMMNMEFKHIFLYDEGWEGWSKAGLPTEK